MIVPASFIPETCCIAPLIPHATYSFGCTVLPLWPTWRVFGSQSMSVRGREAPTTPPIVFANSSTMARFFFSLIPRPALTTMSAAEMSMSWTWGFSYRTNRAPSFDPSMETSTFVIAAGVGSGSDAFTDAPPEWGARSRPRATSWRVGGLSFPSRCSAITRTFPIASPAVEALLPEDLGEPLRLLGHRAGEHLRVALRLRRGQPPDAERVSAGEVLPRRDPEGCRPELPDRLPSRFHDRGEGRVPRRVDPELDREDRGQVELDDL